EDLGALGGLALRLEVERGERVVALGLVARSRLGGARLARLGVDLALVGELEGGVPRALGLFRGLGDRPLVLVRHFLSSSSSTISASTTSSSSAEEPWGSPCGASPAGAPSAPACCSVA